MHTPIPSRLLLGIAACWLAGCQAPTLVSEVDPPCVVTPAAAAHIQARHCAAPPLPVGANQFVPAYCTPQGMQTFCAMVQNAALKHRLVQPDGRIRYDANLNLLVVGTISETCGRMVMEPDGQVVTQFPELAGAPQPPACHHP